MENPKILSLTPRWAVVAKPPRWLVIPGRSPGLPVLREWVERETGAPVWVVHRIDRDTSGVVLFARDPDSHREASQWFEKHRVRKTYHAIATGLPTMPMLRLDSPIEGAPARTQVEVVEKSALADVFFAQVRIDTGKRHQIRIHLGGAGHPLAGDSEYRGPRELLLREGGALDVERVALHARSLELPTGEKFVAPWPEDFRGWVGKLFSEAGRAARAGRAEGDSKT